MCAFCGVRAVPGGHVGPPLRGDGEVGAHPRVRLLGVCAVPGGHVGPPLRGDGEVGAHPCVRLLGVRAPGGHVGTPLWDGMGIFVIQIPGHWVVVNIFADASQIRFIPNDVIIIIPLP